MPKQCVMFRKSTTDRLRINAAMHVQAVGISRDTVNGNKDTFVLRHPAVNTSQDFGPLFGGINDLCLEDLNIWATGTGSVSVIFFREGGPADGIILWSGSIPAFKSLRYREEDGFYIV
jgi:hypothetical protein